MNEAAQHVVRLTPAELTGALSSVMGASPLVLQLDGLRMQSGPELYDEFARGLQFPSCFGRNWNALWDMLTDLSWLPFTRLWLVIAHPDSLLSFGKKNDRAALLELLEETGIYWATPVQRGEWFDRPALEFRTVLLDR